MEAQPGLGFPETLSRGTISRSGQPRSLRFFRFPAWAENVDELKTWWEIAQVAGAGAAVVLGPALYFLWRAYEKDIEYSREIVKSTVTVITELTRVFENDGKSIAARHADLKEQISGCFDETQKHLERLEKRVESFHSRLESRRDG